MDQTVKVKAERSSLDGELRAMAQVLKLVEGLERAAAGRVLAWVSSKVWERDNGTTTAPPAVLPQRHLPGPDEP